MKTVSHPSNTRGVANHGWLESYHSFSFASYYNPERLNFGALRVLNDDFVAAGRGFGKHPHDNMEIISIPLEGDLVHSDSLGNEGVIREGDVQVLSAGTGIAHSEYNRNSDKPVKFLQIWVVPHTQQVAPRYDQISIRDLEKENEWYQVLSPNSEDDGVWIHQNAWFHLGKFTKDQTVDYTLKLPDNGVYIFVLDGAIDVSGHQLNKRDALGVWETDSISVKASEGTQVLLLEVPMN